MNPLSEPGAVCFGQNHPTATTEIHQQCRLPPLLESSGATGEDQFAKDDSATTVSGAMATKTEKENADPLLPTNKMNVSNELLASASELPASVSASSPSVAKILEGESAKYVEIVVSGSLCHTLNIPRVLATLPHLCPLQIDCRCVGIVTESEQASGIIL